MLRRNPHFMDSISRPLPMPHTPFEDPRGRSPPPQMRYADGTLVIAGTEGAARPTRSLFDDEMEHSPTRFSGSLHSASLASARTTVLSAMGRRKAAAPPRHDVSASLAGLARSDWPSRLASASSGCLPRASTSPKRPLPRRREATGRRREPPRDLGGHKHEHESRRAR